MRNTMHSASVAVIASNLGLPRPIIEAWASRGDLPIRPGGLYDEPWATWLAAGRRATEWRRDVPARKAVAIGWLGALSRTGRKPVQANLAAFDELFIRNGFGRGDAAQSLAAGRA